MQKEPPLQPQCFPAYVGLFKITSIFNAIFDLSYLDFGTQKLILGRLGAPWERLGPSWAVLEGVLSRLKSSWKRLEGLGPSWARLGPSWRVLEAFWVAKITPRGTLLDMEREAPFLLLYVYVSLCSFRFLSVLFCSCLLLFRLPARLASCH